MVFLTSKDKAPTIVRLLEEEGVTASRLKPVTVSKTYCERCSGGLFSTVLRLMARNSSVLAAHGRWRCDSRSMLSRVIITVMLY